MTYAHDEISVAQLATVTGAALSGPAATSRITKMAAATGLLGTGIGASNGGAPGAALGAVLGTGLGVVLGTLSVIAD